MNNKINNKFVPSPYFSVLPFRRISAGNSPVISTCPTPKRSPSPLRFVNVSSQQATTSSITTLGKQQHLNAKQYSMDNINKKAVVFTVQPMPGENKLNNELNKKKTTAAEECCVECGRFCVALVSALK